jgi:WD40 repeat protein
MYVWVPGEILIFVTVSCPLPQGNRAISAYRSYSADGKTLASGNYDHTVKLWDAQTGREMATLNGRGIVSSVAVSPDGKTLASGSWDNTVKLWVGDARQ